MHQEMGSQVMAQQVVPGGQWGREQLSGFEGKAHLAQITQDRAMAPGGRIGHEAKRQSPAPASLKTSMAPGIGALSLDQDSVDIKEECLHHEDRAVGTPTHPRLEAHTNDLKEMAPKMGLAAMPIGSVDTSWAS